MRYRRRFFIHPCQVNNAQRARNQRNTPYPNRLLHRRTSLLRVVKHQTELSLVLSAGRDSCDMETILPEGKWFRNTPLAPNANFVCLFKNILRTRSISAAFQPLSVATGLRDPRTETPYIGRRNEKYRF
ncbi:hypothetical protein, partial [Acetobacter sp.]|uniref:hypothetical protein n=1 Tax=Acetobacter sp. TaxID=440 RepID=UPI0039E8AB6C